MIYSNEFLKDLFSQRSKTIYAKIIALDNNSHPLSQIDGKVTGGSINLDGASAMRRTCSVSLIASNNEINDYLWTLNTKFKLSIGLEDNIKNSKSYKEIIWFPQGEYVITQFSYSISLNNCNINISGKDKMCLLNGEVGGTFNSEIDFGTIQEADGSLTKILIKDIIIEMIHAYAKEPFSNIVLNDLDEKGLMLQEYRYSSPLYLARGVNENEYLQAFLNGETPVYVNGKETKLNDSSSIVYESLSPSPDASSDATKVKFELSGNECIIAKIEYGDTAGYTITDLTFPGDLIAKPGETICSIMDKIINMLGDYEYFYNVYGQFVFQKKSTSPSELMLDSSSIITAVSNAPDIKNVRNDFSVWGIRKGVTGADLPIHYRYAIGKKPISYISYDGKNKYTTEPDPNQKMRAVPSGKVLWNDSTKKIFWNQPTSLLAWNRDSIPAMYDLDYREIIYQMALDYRKYNHTEDFELRLAENNPEYLDGSTGYEQYYVDLLGFWRELYKPAYEFDNELQVLYKEVYDWKRKLKEIYQNRKPTEEELKEIEKKQQEYIDQESKIIAQKEESIKNNGFSPIISENPEQLNFYFELLDTQGELIKYSNEAIGNRPKVDNNNNIKTIFNRKTPNIIFYSHMPENEQRKSGYRYFQVGAYQNLFSVSAQGRSAQEQIHTLLNNHTYATESINLTTIPLYYLEPETEFYINDKVSKLTGKYRINKISIPLTFNGTSSINIIKVIEDIQ